MPLHSSPRRNTEVCHYTAHLDEVGVGAVVSVPEEHPDAVDDVGMVQLHGDPFAVVAGDGVGGVALLATVVLGVSVEQHVLHLSLDGTGITLWGGYILFWDCVWWRCVCVYMHI